MGQYLNRYGLQPIPIQVLSPAKSNKNLSLILLQFLSLVNFQVFLNII